MLLNLTEN